MNKTRFAVRGTLLGIVVLLTTAFIVIAARPAKQSVQTTTHTVQSANAAEGALLAEARCKALAVSANSYRSANAAEGDILAQERIQADAPRLWKSSNAAEGAWLATLRERESQNANCR